MTQWRFLYKLNNVAFPLWSAAARKESNGSAGSGKQVSTSTKKKCSTIWEKRKKKLNVQDVYLLRAIHHTMRDSIMESRGSPFNACLQRNVSCDVAGNIQRGTFHDRFCPLTEAVKCNSWEGGVKFLRATSALANVLIPCDDSVTGTGSRPHSFSPRWRLIKTVWDIHAILSSGSLKSALAPSPITVENIRGHAPSCEVHGLCREQDHGSAGQHRS